MMRPGCSRSCSPAAIELTLGKPRRGRAVPRTPTTGSYADFVAPATGDANRSVGDAVGQLQPLVLPQPSQTKQLPAGRIFVPQFIQSGASADVPRIDSTSSVELCAVGGASCAVSTTISSCSWLANAEPV